MNDFGTDIGHTDFTSQTYNDWQYYWKSIYQCDQYPHAQYYTSSRDGFISWQNFHQYTSTFEYDNGWTKVNHNLPEGCRPRRLFCNRRNSMREMNMGNNTCAAFDHYDYTSHMLNNRAFLGFLFTHVHYSFISCHSSVSYLHMRANSHFDE